MEDYVDIMEQDFQPYLVRNMTPEVREVYERRANHHKMISNLLDNNMIEVTDEVRKPFKPEEVESAKNEGEDEKQQEKEKKE